MNDNTVPLPGLSDQTFGHELMGSFYAHLGSPFCKHLHLHLDPEGFDFHIEFHETETPTFAIALMRETAFRRGYVQDCEIGADPYDSEEFMGDGIWRVYLTPKDPISDKRNEDMPSLIETAYGPYSGFMEAMS